MEDRASRPDNRLPAALACVALATLMLELLLIRVLDVILRPELGHAVITCALFGFSIAGVYSSVRPLKEDVSPEEQVAPVALLFAVSILLLRPALNATARIYEPIPWDWLRFSVGGGLFYAILLVPFVLSGLLFAYLFSAYPSRIRSLYFWDLGGAALGSVIFLPFLRPIGPGGLLLWASAVALACFGLLTASRHRRILVLGGALVLVAVPCFLPGTALEFLIHQDKRGVASAQRAGRIEFSEWDPISKIDVVPQSDRVLHVAYDGGSQSSHFFRFDGDYEALRRGLLTGVEAYGSHFWHKGVVASAFLKRDQGTDVLVIGSAAGQETKAALTFGAASVDGVELVRTVVNLGRDRYAGFSGHVLANARVANRTGEGRSFLRSTTDSYDVIQIHSNHTSSYVAAGIGGATPIYLQTVEAYEEYFTHLRPDGILHYNHYFYPRMVATAARAWKNLGRTGFRRHVLVFENPGDLTLPTVLIKMSPWTQQEVSEARAFFSVPGDATHRAVVDPLDQNVGMLSEDFFTGSLPPELVEQVDYRITPPTDDRPFFNHIQRHRRAVRVDPAALLDEAMVSALNGRSARPFGEYTSFVGITAIALFFAILLVVVPLRLSRAGREQWPMKTVSNVYFSLLGLGFIIIELTMIQMFMKLLGFPLYAYSVVIFTLLLAAGTGSLTAGAMRVSPDRHWWVPFLGVLVAGACFIAFHATVVDLFLPMVLPVRILAAAATVFPLGFFLGMPFPLGILRLEEAPPGAVAWAWGANGLFTVFGGVVTGVLAMELGFRATFLAALMVYAAAMLVFSRFRSKGPSPLRIGIMKDPTNS